jgi:tRNA(Ile)-lysidine synthase
MKTLNGNFLKPLLNFSKDELTHYLLARKLDWRDDASNEDKKYKRNAVRLELIPMLEKMCGGKEALQKRVFELSEQSSEVFEMIENEVFFIYLFYNFF